MRKQAIPGHMRVTAEQWERVFGSKEKPMPIGVLRRETDSAGITVDYYKIESVPIGAHVAEGWRPFLVVKSISSVSRQARLHFEDGHAGGWFPWGTPVPCEVLP